MKTSDNGIEYLKRLEGFESCPYIDQAGKKTVGYGHVILPEERFNFVSEQAAEDILKKDLRPAEYVINSTVKIPLTQNQFDALVIFTYNIGCVAFRNSTLLKYLNAKELKDVLLEWMKWTHVTQNNQKIVSAGLVNRREAEIELFKRV